MSYIFRCILIAISVAFASAQTSIDAERCKERVITKCPCGSGGNSTDVYVDGCRVISNDSLPCQPCPGSCSWFLNCEKCSKHVCLSCPLGRTGPTCELLHSDNDSMAENNNTAAQNAEESSSSTNATPAEIVQYGFDQPMPNMVVLDLSKIKNSSFRPAVDGNRPEIKLDMIEFNAGNTSIVKAIPGNMPYVLENNSTVINETVLDIPQICTTNCSNETENRDSVGTVESDKDVRSNNETDFRNGIDVAYPQKNEAIIAPLGDRKFSGEFLPFGEPSPIELPPVNDSVNTSDGLQKDNESENKDNENRLAMHRSPNPSAEEDKSKILRHVLKKNLNNGYDQLEPGDSHQQDLDDSYQQDYSENPSISKDQKTANEIQNRTGSQNNDSQPELSRKTTTETKYVYISANDENESKYPDAEYEPSSPLEQKHVADEKLNDSDVQIMKPGQQYDFPDPHQLKQYFGRKEEAILKSKLGPFSEDLRKSLCKAFPNILVSCQNTADDAYPKRDLDSHADNTFGYFRSPEVSPNPGTELLFPNTENKAPSSNFANDPAMDTVEQNIDEYSEIHKNGFVDLEKEQPVVSLDAIQQQNDQYFESHGNTHKPIPKNLGTFDPYLSNPSHSYYISQRYAKNLVPSSPKWGMIPGPPNSREGVVNFEKSRVPILFDYILGLAGPHMTPVSEDRSHSGLNRSHRSQKVLPATNSEINMPKPLIPLPFNHATNIAAVGSLIVGNDLQKSNSNISFVPLNFRNTEPKDLFSLEFQKTPVVKGLLLMVKMTHENGTAPRIVPGSVRGKNFEFEIPMAIPSLYADSKESKNLKTERAKHGKESRRFKKLHNKRRRNGVKNDSSKCDPRIEDRTTIHGKHTKSLISGKTKHAMNSKAARKDKKNLGSVRIKYVMDDNEPMYDSLEISASSMPNRNAFYPQAYEYHFQPQDMDPENFTTEYETEASSDSNSDSEPTEFLIRNPRRSRRDVEATPFCPIPRDSRNGDLDCTIWSYKKTCTLVCHNGYSSPSQYFTCQRSKNTWVPPMVSCKGGPGYEPLGESGIQLKQLDDNPPSLEDEEEEPLSPRNEDNNKEDYDEKSSGEMEARDQGGEEEEVVPTVLPVKTHAHKKKVHLNSAKEHDENQEEEWGREMGARDQGGEEEEEVVPTDQTDKTHAHKKKVHLNSVKEQDENQEEVEDKQKVHKAQTKSDTPAKHPKNPVADDGKASKEETEEVAPKTGSDEEQSEEQSSNEEVDEEPKDQEVVQNDVNAEYDGYERRK